MTPGRHATEHPDEGFMLVAVIVAIFLILLALSVAAPRVATELKHERELESAHRANQYVRAIRQYYIKFKRYPNSIDQLEKSNNQRFLRQKYVDPLTGKDDWRIIHVGENKTTVKGLFGADLGGPAPGLGSASSLVSGSNPGPISNGSAFGNNGSSGGSQSAFGNSGSGGGGSFGGSGGSSFGGNSGGSSFGGGSGGSSFGGSGGSSFGGNSGGSNGQGTSVGSTGFGTPIAKSGDGFGGGGPIMGIGSAKSGSAILVVNEQDDYSTWEFLYDPRVEQLKAQASLLGGVPTGNANPFGGSNATAPGSVAPTTPPVNNLAPPAAPQ